MNCPYCSSSETVYKAKARKWECCACEKRFKGGAPSPTAATILPNDPAAGLPSPVAVPWAEYLREDHPVAKLWAACDTVEMLLRLLVIAMIADQRKDEALDENVAKQLADTIESPTMGAWFVMAQNLAVSTSHTSVLKPAADFVKGALCDLLYGPTKPGTPETSFLKLRNRLAHGGGLTRREAERLLRLWYKSFEECIGKNAAAWLRSWELLGKDNSGQWLCMMGSEKAIPTDLTRNLPALPDSDAVILRVGGQVFHLWPLALFGKPALGNADFYADADLAQIYSRREPVRLCYTPIGSCGLAQSESGSPAMKAFEKLFRLDRPAPSNFVVRDFLKEIHQDARQMVGREKDKETILDAVKIRTQGVLWIQGVAGIGKSFLLAQVAADLLEQHDESNIHVLPYRFRVSDNLRCSRDAFADFVTERLAKAGAMMNQTGRKEITKAEDKLKASLSSLNPEHRVILILDGLDEISRRDSRFAREIPLALNLPGVLWVCSGRPDAEIQQSMLSLGAVSLFADGLPRMEAADIREMILEKIGPLRKKLLLNDQETGDQVVNPFISRVTNRAAGLPLYVKYVIGDVLAGEYRVLDGNESLPASLDAYHEKLLKRLSIGDLQAIVTPLVATLATAYEPLTARELTAILNERKLLTADLAGESSLDSCLAAIAGMLATAPDPDGETGFILFHQSLRDHILNSSQMTQSVATARAAFAEIAGQPIESHAKYLKNYICRSGVRHLLDEGKWEAAKHLLIDFKYLQRRTAIESPARVPVIVEEFRDLRQRLGNPLEKAEFAKWEAFFREHAHLLRRGDESWPMHKILLQVAAEHADDSPITLAAEKWLDDENCDWLWMRSEDRPASVESSKPVHTLETNVWGVLPISQEILYSWDDREFKQWNLNTGIAQIVRRPAPVAMFPSAVAGEVICVYPDGLKWLRAESADKLRVFPFSDFDEGVCGIDGAMALTEGRILTWSDARKEVQVWDSSGNYEVFGDLWVPSITQSCELPNFRGLLQLDDQRLLVWGKEPGMINVWDLRAKRFVHRWAVHTPSSDDGLSFVVKLLPGGNFITHDFLEKGSVVKLWSKVDFSLIAECNVEIEYSVILPLDDDRILVLEHYANYPQTSGSHVLDLTSGKRIQDVKLGNVVNALRLTSGRIVVWRTDGTCRSNLYGDIIILEDDLKQCRRISRAHFFTTELNVKHGFDVIEGPGNWLTSYSSVDQSIKVWDYQAQAAMELLTTGNMDHQPHDRICGNGPLLINEADCYPGGGSTNAKWLSSCTLNCDIDADFEVIWPPPSISGGMIMEPEIGKVSIRHKKLGHEFSIVDFSSKALSELQLLCNGAQLAWRYDYVDCDKFDSPIKCVYESENKLRNHSMIRVESDEDCHGLRLASYLRTICLFARGDEIGDVSPSAQWEGDFGWCVRWITSDGAIAIGKIGGTVTKSLRVYLGRNLLHGKSLANLPHNIDMYRLCRQFFGSQIDTVRRSCRETDIPTFREMFTPVLDSLKDRERAVIELRFGLKDGYSRTLEEVENILQVGREDILKIESRALRKMRHPDRIRKLERLNESAGSSRGGRDDALPTGLADLIAKHVDDQPNE
jgi:WD40 repeat protein